MPEVRLNHKLQTSENWLVAHLTSKRFPYIKSLFKQITVKGENNNIASGTDITALYQMYALFIKPKLSK